MSEGGEDGPFVSTGTFKGYVVFGHDSAVSIELDSSHGEDAGTVRIIPCSSVLSIDVLSLKREEDEKTGDERGVYFR